MGIDPSVVHAITAEAELPAPAIDLLGKNVVPPSHRCRTDPGDGSFLQDGQLLRIRPAPTALGSRENLKSRHVMASKLIAKLPSNLHPTLADRKPSVTGRLRSLWVSTPTMTVSDMVSCIMVLQVREPDAAFRWDRTVMGWRSLKLL